MGNTPTPATVKRLRYLYPAGSTVVFDQNKGKVLCVDDVGTVHVKLENGSYVGLAYGEEKYHLAKGE